MCVEAILIPLNPIMTEFAMIIVIGTNLSPINANWSYTTFIIYRLSWQTAQTLMRCGVSSGTTLFIYVSFFECIQHVQPVQHVRTLDFMLATPLFFPPKQFII